MKVDVSNKTGETEPLDVEEPKRMTKLEVRHSDSPISLYEIGIKTTDDGSKHITNPRNRTRDFEYWHEPENMCWMVPDGDYLVAQGRGIYLANVSRGEVTWEGIGTIADDVQVNWSGIRITIKSPEPVVEVIENGPQIQSRDANKKPKKSRR